MYLLNSTVDFKTRVCICNVIRVCIVKFRRRRFRFILNCQHHDLSVKHDTNNHILNSMKDMHILHRINKIKYCQHYARPSTVIAFMQIQANVSREWC